MIDQLTELTNKTNELEALFQNLKQEQNNEKSQTNCLSFTRNFSSLDVILPKKILIAKVEPSKNSNILFQCLIDLTLSESESVEISFLVGGFSIYKYRKVLNAGSNQISIMQNYEPLTSEKFYVHLEITPLSNKLVTINYVSLFAWGNLINDVSPVYQAIETNNKYLLSVLDNNCIYSTFTEKKEKEYNFSDLDFIDTAISYCYLYSDYEEAIYLFRVDLKGNLFYSNIDTRNEKFIANGVSFVSADISSSNKMVVTYIKNNQCYYCEIDDNKIISIHRRLYCNYVALSKCHCFYNKYRDKFLIILSSTNDNNYLIEQINEDMFNKNYVVADYSFTVATIGSEL